MHATLLTMLLVVGHGHDACPHGCDTFCTDRATCVPASAPWSTAWRKPPAVRPRYQLRYIPRTHGNPYRDPYDYRTAFGYPWFLEPPHPFPPDYGSTLIDDGLFWPPGVEAPLPLPSQATPPLAGDPRIKRVADPPPRLMGP